MTEKQISEEDLIAVSIAITRADPNYFSVHVKGDEPREWKAQNGFRAMSHEATKEIALVIEQKARAAIQALHSRGWRRREDVLEDAALHFEGRIKDIDKMPAGEMTGRLGHELGKANARQIAKDLRALKDTP